jgi:hypothetical protein
MKNLVPQTFLSDQQQGVEEEQKPLCRFAARYGDEQKTRKAVQQGTSRWKLA